MARINIGNVKYKPAVGEHHIQFKYEPTPASIWAGTTWEIDTDYQGRTIIGSGGSYNFGEKGGEPEHTLTINEVPPHTHEVPAYTNGTGFISAAANAEDTNNSYSFRTGSAGGGQPHNNMPPYRVVNIWKRTA